ncbi:branched-subunit amino acid aminotransferase/4-amino-4-deoxychorismate lyase [Amycolatopsis endophytica]|uniref:Branched-subunit amino acid aminotransferase/4-amino-4-deoxychorismate lyase n=1 Tax=Amycolatopsis endophytica TaxID=860233 RepID=A0A853B4I2_9PSEU|nr:aminotransferase class IV family protein [Amycolatopsis endophytica]NYI89732.1 branched-subunit amino acid aminotransferase/4-amino-4-deoxychorismate lyase [Amycolatopsis endophytica]
MSDFVVQRNGRPATVEDLAPLAFAGYAHFTAMQVRGRRIRGLDLHLDRLRSASAEMFGRPVPDEAVLACLRAAVKDGPEDVSLTATVYSDDDVLVRTRPAASPPAGPLALTAVEYERVLPEFKHVGEVAKTYYPRRADGFDDVAFVDRRGHFTEASIWNLAFWDGSAVVWPDAPMLKGTTMNILRRRLDRLGVPQRSRVVTPADLPSLRGAVVMNSWTPGVAVSRIDDVELRTPESFVKLLHDAYEEEPLVAP